MNISVDLHGTINRYPDKFRKLMEDWKGNGHQVTVMTGPPKDEAEDELMILGFVRGKHYDHVISITEYLRDFLKVKIKKNEDGLYTDPLNWWPAKGDLCNRFNIDILIDDTQEYGRFLDKSKTMFLNLL